MADQFSDQGSNPLRVAVRLLAGGMRELPAKTSATTRKERTKMRTLTLTTLCLPAIAALPAMAAGKYPPIADYMMTKDAEIALAQSAAPAGISDHATVK